MSEERRAIAAARRAARKRESIEQPGVKPLGEVAPAIPKPKPLDPNIFPSNNAAEATNDVADTSVSTPADNNDLTNVNTIHPQQAQVQNTNDAPKTITFSDLLENQRKKAAQEKTDAEKMQRYYALTDALNAIGKMGGAVIGGAIGGNVLDSAPNVGEYKPSRGYIDAFEKVKKAKDRLRELDDKEFALTLNTQQREEERAYRAQVAEEERKYRAQQAELERQFRKASEEEKVALQREMLDAKLAHEKALKKMSLDIVKMQTRGEDEKTEPVVFDNGAYSEIPVKYYKGLKAHLMGRKIGGEIVGEENIDRVIRSNPEIVNDYLKKFGYGFADTTTTPQSSSPQAKDNGSESKKSGWFLNSFPIGFAINQIKKRNSNYSEESDPFSSYRSN